MSFFYKHVFTFNKLAVYLVKTVYFLTSFYIVDSKIVCCKCRNILKYKLTKSEQPNSLTYIYYFLYETLKSIRDVRLYNRKVLCALGSNTKYFERIFVVLTFFFCRIFRSVLFLSYFCRSYSFLDNFMVLNTLMARNLSCLNKVICNY